MINSKYPPSHFVLSLALCGSLLISCRNENQRTSESKTGLQQLSQQPQIESNSNDDTIVSSSTPRSYVDDKSNSPSSATVSPTPKTYKKEDDYMAYLGVSVYSDVEYDENFNSSLKLTVNNTSTFKIRSIQIKISTCHGGSFDYGCFETVTLKGPFAPKSMKTITRKWRNTLDVKQVNARIVKIMGQNGRVHDYSDMYKTYL